MNESRHAPRVRADHLARRAIVEGALAALVVYVAAGLGEAALIRLLRPTELELTWVSDLVLSAALGIAVYLWRHLRATRLELTERERAEVVIQTQLSLAEAMQRRLLPAVPAAANGFAWAATLMSAGKIGGDFYDFIEPVGGTTVMLVADVSGKGVPAAMALGLLRSTFRMLARETQSPSDLAGRMSAALYAEWHGTPYVTCIIARVDRISRTLTYTNAGHPAGVLVSRGTDRYLTRGGPPMGLLEDARFEAEHIDLSAGDVCVFVTDGITEAFETALQSPVRVIAESARKASGGAEDICDAVMTQARNAPGPAGVNDWDDDRTVVVVALRDD
jgi:sigma-B regulation protein RsbU (phosphoserine phosphatase)